MKEFLRRKNVEISLRRYGIDALGAMAQGLFCSLLVGTILDTVGRQFGVPFLARTVAPGAGTDYTGGGLLAKWTAAHGFYVEGSFRAGTVHDDAKNVLHDDVNTYSYDTNANYFGAHIGMGKEIEVANNNTVDVYGKFFFNRRNGVSFDAGPNRYDLDAVKSEILRVGARYTMKREKWNFYAGAAYEHEFGGEATGTVNGLPIRSADIKGSSVRAELGATMKPDKNSPWSLDLNVAGFAGKKQGVSGGISVSFMF